MSGADSRLPQPYLLFLGDVRENAWAKTAFGLRDWAPERCIGEYALPGASVTIGLPQLTPQEAKALAADGRHLRLIMRAGELVRNDLN